MSKIIFTELATKPSPPSSGQVELYVKTDEIVYIQGSDGVEIPLGSSASITALTGDVSAVGPGSAVATVNFVGGASAASVATSVTLTQAATSADTPNTLVLRDSSGNFSAGTITANLTGNVSGSAGSFTGSLSGDVTGTQSATIVSFVGGASAASVATSVTLTQAATSADTPNTLVLRDSSGNFSAGTITANLTGVASGNLIPPQNKVIVQQNPGIGQFSSVAAAIASITTASSSNPFEVWIEPGIYTEPSFTMKPYVYVTAGSIGSVTLVAQTPNSTFITGIDNSGIARIIISGANGLNGIGLFHQGTLGQAFIVRFCSFNNNTINISTSATVGNPSRLEVDLCYFTSPFTTGVLATTDGASVNQVLITTLVYANQVSSYATDIIVGHGTGLLLDIADCQFLQPSGNCIRVYDGMQLFVTSVSIIDFSKALWVQNTGAAPLLSISGLQTLTNTVDVQIDHTTTTGSINGSFTTSNSTINSPFISIFTADPTDGVTITGSINYGDQFSDRTDVTNLILEGPAMGVYSGGTLSSGGGFIINVSAGNGYFSSGVPDTYLVWPNSSITLSANSNNYIYWNSSSVLTAGSVFPDTTANILLGRIVTNSIGIELIDASPMYAHHYGNMNDNFIREALGSVFAFGCQVSENVTPLELDVTNGSYFFGDNNFLPSSGTAITFQTFYRDGSGGWVVGSSNTVDTNNYDNGTGTLQPIPVGQYARHTLYLVGQGSNQQYMFVYAQTTYLTLLAAQLGNIPTPPSYFSDGVVLLASIIVSQGSTSIIAGGGQIIDNRPRIGFSSPAVNAVGTVASVALSLPTSVFSVSGSPVTSSGTLTGNLNTQSANTVWAGPATGSAATPDFRSLVSADIPNNAANTSGTAANITATSNSTLVTLSSLSLPTSQLSGTISLTTQVNGILPIANGGTNASTAALAFTNLSPLTTAGDIIYENSTPAPTRLAIGSTGQVLTVSGGLPTWSAPATSGTVTSVGTGTGLTGGPITTSGTISLAAIASDTFLANSTGSSTAPVSTTLTSMLDAILGTAQGSIIYRNSTIWTSLAPGTNGQFLQTEGASANPQWANAVNSIGTYDSQTSQANGLDIVGEILYAQSATVSNPGMVNTTTQSFAGNKTFTGTVAITPASTSALVINTSSFIFDSINNAFGIGLQPATSVMIDGLNTSGTSKLVQMTGYGVGSTTGYRGRFARGTVGSPIAVQTGDILSAISGRGYGASQFATSSTGVMNIVAGETFTNTSNLTYLQFSTTPTGSVTSAESMRIASTGVTLGSQSSSTAVHQINGGLSGTTNTITASTYTIDNTTTDYIVYTDSTSNAITITLPVPTNGRILVIEDKTGKAGTNNVTVNPHASEKINGSSTFIISQNYGSIRITSDGTNWFVQALPPNVATTIFPVVPISSTTIDWSLGNVYTKTLSANTTFTFSNATPGQTLLIRLTNTISNYTVTWPTIKWPVQTTPVMTTGAVSDIYSILYDGTTYFGTYTQNY